MLTASAGRGFTLVELMIATVTTLIVLGSIYHSVVVTQRAARAQGEQLAVQSNVRGAVLVVANELRELSVVQGGTGAQNDILNIGPGGVSYRAMRGIGFTCTPTSTDQVRISRGSFSGFRDPQAGRDSMLVYADTVGAGTEPGWIPLPITKVTTSTACPESQPGITLTTAPRIWLAGREPGVPVRVYELMELRAYQSEGKSWLGTRSISAGEAIQPLFGPLSDHDGFRLGYLDWAGRPTTDAAAVRSIALSVHGTTHAADEQLTTEIALRNVAP